MNQLLAYLSEEYAPLFGCWHTETMGWGLLDKHLGYLYVKA